MKLFGYARYSSVQQQAGYSIEAQVDAIRHWAGANGHHICGFYIDRARSAFKDVKKRGAFQKMITALLAGEAEGVVIHKLDRFARNEEDSVIYAAMLRREGKRLFSVTEPMVGGDSPTDRLTEGMLRVLAEFYSLLLGAESKKGTSAMARRGLWPQHPPFGYRRDPETKILLPDENSEIVREAFLEMVSGRWTMRGWTAEAKRRGYRTPAGRPIAYSQWYAIFKRRLYTGIIPWKGDIFPGRHEPLVSPDIFEAVQSLLAERRGNSRQARMRHFYLLRGLVWSAVYNAPMHGNTVRNRERKLFRYYRALGPGREHNAACERVERGVRQLLANITATGGDIDTDNRFLAGMLRFAPTARAVYDYLTDDDERRAMLGLVFARAGIAVDAAGDVSVRLLQENFNLVEEK